MNKTYYQLIIDRSGSMSSIREATFKGLNEQLQIIRELKEKYPDQEYRLSITQFDHEIDYLLDRDNGEVKAFSWDQYEPRGMTALYDAIGKSVKRLRKAIKDELKEGKASVVVIILTDGHENASQKWSYEKLQKLIKKLEATDLWTFTYLGSTPDAVEIADRLNIKRENAAYFDKAQMRKTFGRMRKSMTDRHSYMDEYHAAPAKFLADEEEE